MEPTVSSETSTIRTQTPVNYPKKNTLRLLICLKNSEERKKERENKKRNPEDKVNWRKETNVMWKLSKKGKMEESNVKEKDREFVKIEEETRAEQEG